MGNAHLALNMGDGLGDHIRRFPQRQKRNGFFESQEGEWDANGQVLWLAERWRRTVGLPIRGALLAALLKGAEWIEGKRMKGRKDSLSEGLLPAGFSAEHLGPNDYYYWDDFWAIAGLEAASSLASAAGRKSPAHKFAAHAEDMRRAVFRSIAAIPKRQSQGCIPASPYRRMDAGAVGSMVADYPLMITSPGDERIMNTIAYMMGHYFFEGGFFQDMVHSGVNIYLTLAIAQTLLRAGDRRFAELLQTAADLASPTGNWPEAVHPFSGGGCMGDGQHGWAAAEWVMMVRNLFVREENDTLVLGSGLLPQWIGEKAFLGPTATPFGLISLTVSRGEKKLTAHIEAQWHRQAPRIVLALPDHRRLDDPPPGQEILLDPL
jgi:hypothetical protein